MDDDVNSATLASSEPIDTILGHVLSPGTGRFVAEYADFLVRVDFKDISFHPAPEVRSSEGYYCYSGKRHSIWLDRGSADFEGLLMHETLRGVLLEKGYPRTMCPAVLHTCPYLPYLGFLLSSAIIDPVIDRRLTQGGFRVYNRKVLIDRIATRILIDARQRDSESYEFLTRKWILLTVLLDLDPTFSGDDTDRLKELIHDKLPLSAKLAARLAACIKEEGFSDPYSALTAMMRLRDSLKLQEMIPIMDGNGMRW
jgi:hypothetical protein